MPEADVWQTTRLLCKTPLHCPLVVNIGNTAMQKKKKKSQARLKSAWLNVWCKNKYVGFFLFLFSQMEKRLSNYSILLICSSYGTSKHAMQAAGSASKDHTIPTCDTYKDEIRHIPRPSINYLSIIIKQSLAQWYVQYIIFERFCKVDWQGCHQEVGCHYSCLVVYTLLAKHGC